MLRFNCEDGKVKCERKSNKGVMYVIALVVEAIFTVWIAVILIQAAIHMLVG